MITRYLPNQLFTKKIWYNRIARYYSIQIGTFVYNISNGIGLHNGVRGTSGHDWNTGEPLTAKDQMESLGLVYD